MTRRRKKIVKDKSGVLTLLAKQNSERAPCWQGYICGWRQGKWGTELLDKELGTTI